MRLEPIVIAIGLLAATPSLAQEDLLGLPGPIIFQAQEFELAWSSQPSQTYVKHEYVPSGQDVETFQDMFLVEAVWGPITPMDAARSQIQSLEVRRGSDPVLNYELLENAATGEVMLDFLTSDLSAEPVIEWNAYRYAPIVDGVGLFAISRRGYGEEGAKDFLEKLGTIRTESIAALAVYELPPIAQAR